MRSLIVGDGYLAATLAEQLSGSGVSVGRAPCPDRPALDVLVGAQQVDQIVMTPQAVGWHVDGFVDRVDGPRWVVCSWAGGSTDSPASATDRTRPLEDLVLERGGTVLRLSAVFGRGGDDNVTRIARCLRRDHTVVGVEKPRRPVQPLPLYDPAALVRLPLR